VNAVISLDAGSILTRGQVKSGEVPAASQCVIDSPDTSNWASRIVLVHDGGGVRKLNRVTKLDEYPRMAEPPPGLTSLSPSGPLEGKWSSMHWLIDRGVVTRVNCVGHKVSGS
jgi:hypothetical protein